MIHDAMNIVENFLSQVFFSIAITILNKIKNSLHLHTLHKALIYPIGLLTKSPTWDVSSKRVNP